MPKIVPSFEPEALGRRGRRSGDRARSRRGRRERPEHLLARDDAVARPARRAADVHVLDEADLGAPFLRALDERDELVVVDAADHDGVDLERCEPGPRRGLDAAQHARQLVEARELLEPLGPQRVEADRDPVEARRAQGGRVLLEQHAVGRHREVAAATACRRGSRTSAGRSWRTSGSPPVSRMRSDAEGAEDVGEPADLLELEQVRARQPDVLLLGHAVVAAQVAPVRHREAQVAERAAEAVREGHGRSILPA